MILKILDEGLLESNTYIIGNNGEAAVIDPGNPLDDILSSATQAGLKITHIILTHTHFDHIKNLDALRSQTNAKVVVHKLEEPGFSDFYFNVSAYLGAPKTFEKPDLLIEDNNKLEIGDMTFEFIHTPGHSPGSICIKVDNILFSGDTIFYSDFGRTDLGHGSPALLRASVEKIFALDPEIMVYPGHYMGINWGI